MQIRLALSSDAAAISALISSLSHFITDEPSGAGAEDLLKSIQTPAITNYIVSNDFDYFVATSENQIIGVVAARLPNHLYHLFVAEDYQHQGLATQLWQFIQGHIIRTNNAPNITVNSSEYAIPFYERLGFTTVGETVQANGFSYCSMIFQCHKT